MKPTVPEVEPLICEFYARNENRNGGPLHVVLADGNIEDSNIEFCRDEARNEGNELGVRICELLLQMSMRQRAELCGRGGRHRRTR